jgi:two-component system NarL family response regulator
MKILIVDDHVLFREGLVSLLTSQSKFSVVGEAGSIQDAISMTQKLKPDLVLLDVDLPDGSGIEAIKHLLVKRPEMKIVVLTTQENEEHLLTAIGNGAIGYLSKNIPMSQLLKTLQAIDRGEAALSRSMTGRIIDEFQRIVNPNYQNDPDWDKLTPREFEILEILCTGATNQEIAEKLFIAENTVKVHVHNILDKLNVNNRREATRYALRQGIVLPNNSQSYFGV